MKGATNYDDISALNTPVNQVIGILPADHNLEALLQEIHREGIPEDKIGVLAGERDAHKLAAIADKQGPLSALLRRGPDFGDVDRDYFKKFAEAVRQGGRLIAVVEMDSERRREIGQLLSRHGALLVNSFSEFVVEGI